VLQWPVPEPGQPTALTQPGAVKLGVALEPLGELLCSCAIARSCVDRQSAHVIMCLQSMIVHPHRCGCVADELQQKEGSKLNAKADFAKLVALNLFHFMVRCKRLL
jgi:hypothetical protein